MQRLHATALTALILFAGCGGDSGDDAPEEQNIVIPPTSSSTVVEDNDSCTITAESPERAIEDIEELTGGTVVDVEELENNGGLDQQTRTFKLSVKDVVINTGVCSDNEINITVNDNDTSADTNVNVGDQ